MAKQRIMHGAQIDAATPDEVSRIIAAAFDRQRQIDFHRHKGVVKLDGNGVGTDEQQISKQYNWLVERITMTGGANAIIQFFENGQDATGLLEVVQLGSGGLYSDGASNKMFVPAGTRLIVAVSGGGANGQLTYNLQVRLIPSP